MAAGHARRRIDPMHATLGRYDRIDASQDEVIRSGRQLAAALSKAPGFISYALLEVGDGVLATVSVFETQAELAEGERLIAAWAAAHAAPLGPPAEAVTGEILVQKGM
jgi:heme-degrading monooxygenase HmoA